MNPFRASHKTQGIRPQDPCLMKQTDWVCLQNTYDYSPFGVSLDGRTVEGDFYRRGFNGMEKDDEVTGKGNSYTTEFRHYDSRIGRWLSLDPMMSKFPWQSTYCAFDNNPIYFNDPLGLAAQDGGDPQKHVVKRGDTYSSISKKYNVSIENLAITTQPDWEISHAQFARLEN